MREFRFRMWDTEEKLFMNVSRIIESRVNDLYKNGSGRWLYQQWTGLTDINGKEIYEGDVVRFIDKKEFISPIITNLELGTGHYIRCSGKGFYNLNLSTVKIYKIEVIGHAYELS